jgi:hypothetical protein
METKGVLGIGLALMLAAGGASMSAVSLAQAESAKPETKSEGQDKKDLKQGEKPADTADEKTRGFKKGQKPTETMGTMGKEKGKSEPKP